MKSRWILLAAFFAVTLGAIGSQPTSVDAAFTGYPPVMICDPTTGNCGGAGTLGSSGPAAAIACDKDVTLNAQAANVQLVAASGTTTVYVCSYAISVAGTTTPTGNLESGTGSTCGTGSAARTLNYPTGTFTIGSGLGTVARTPAGSALCLYVGGTGPVVSVTVSYAQF